MNLIFDALAKNFNISDLNISWNEISSDVDMNGLKRFIKFNEKLTHLDLSKTFSTDI